MRHIEMISNRWTLGNAIVWTRDLDGCLYDVVASQGGKGNIYNNSDKHAEEHKTVSPEESKFTAYKKFNTRSPLRSNNDHLFKGEETWTKRQTYPYCIAVSWFKFPSLRPVRIEETDWTFSALDCFIS